MSLISTIKSILGLGGDDRGDQGTTVTVERDTDVATEADVGGAGEAPSPPPTTDEADLESPASEEETEAGTSADDAAAVEAETPADEDVDDVEEDAGVDEGGEPVDTITGIGPAYAERLADAGVETVADLASADAASLSDATDIAEARIEGWIEQAGSN